MVINYNVYGMVWLRPYSTNLIELNNFKIMSEDNKKAKNEQCTIPSVSERFLQCSVKRYCVKNDTGNRNLSLKKCLDCKYSLISERSYATYPTKKVKYHEDKDNYVEELKHRG